MENERLPVVARLYTSDYDGRRRRRASVLPGPGEPLVRKSDAEAELRALRRLMHRAIPLLRGVAMGESCSTAASDMWRDFNKALGGIYSLGEKGG